MASRIEGTFAACWLEKESAERLHRHYFGLPGLKEAERFHLTTTYTSAVLEGLKSRRISIRLDHVTFGYDMFGDERNLLVLRVASPELEALHREALKMGATWDYPDFNPHLTLTDSYEGGEGRLPPLPDFDLYVDRYIVEPLPRQKSVPDFIKG